MFLQLEVNIYLLPYIYALSFSYGKISVSILLVKKSYTIYCKMAVLKLKYHTHIHARTRTHTRSFLC